MDDRAIPKSHSAHAKFRYHQVMPGTDIASMIGNAVKLWERGSLFLWALAIALISVGVLSLSLGLYLPDFHPGAWPVWVLALGLGCLILALFKTYQERTIKTLVFFPNIQQSFWHHAPQTDGRKLTQIALRGRMTNVSNQPIYPSEVKLVRPRSRVEHKILMTQEQGGPTYSSNFAVPPGDRGQFSAHFFVDGFVGAPPKPYTVVISVCDQLGHWHRVRFVNLRDPGSRGTK
ncbi:hypothetical protein [Phenylobacterium sp.]|uniref:hypothetical protein n=1 Tax=Phenylobacterium sp. TaxID=1871053 RepID=UPI00120F3E78|nr:hypothetical protein [Phenylobacterium sp.]THD60776.1 MAG: hypothetical protein E8A49_13090 [Phenylobacterium sp.]